MFESGAVYTLLVANAIVQRHEFVKGGPGNSGLCRRIDRAGSVSHDVLICLIPSLAMATLKDRPFSKDYR